MPLKQQKKAEQKKDATTEFEARIQSYINSQYSLIMPVKDDTVIWIKNPENANLVKLKVNSEEYYDFLDKLIGYGLQEKLDKDFAWASRFGNKYNKSWLEYKNKKIKQGE